MSDAFNSIHQAAIRTSLERYRLPHIVPWREYVTGGGMMSYGPSLNDIFRRSAQYMDRILKGASVLPLSASTLSIQRIVADMRDVAAFAQSSCQGSDAFIQCVIDANEKHGGFNSDPRHVVFKQSIPKGLFRLRTPTSGR